MFIKDSMDKGIISSIEIADISDNTSNSDVELGSESTSLLSSDYNDGVIQKAFADSKPRWIDDPVISQWRDPNNRIHKILAELDELHSEWQSAQTVPFAASPDPLWLDTGRAMASVGLPWYTNQLNMPNEVDTSWPFHFKNFETEVLCAAGARVGDPNPSGYVCGYDEANLYCIRALQQELRTRFPTRRPILVYDRFDADQVATAGITLGIEVRRVNLSKPIEGVVQELCSIIIPEGEEEVARPIIFAATLCSSAAAEHDDLTVIAELAQEVPLILHVDAFRSFHYITTAPEHSAHETLGNLRLKLAVRSLDQPLLSSDENGTIIASTIVGSGLCPSRHDPAIALKPATLGDKSTRVAYIRAFDSSLSGSRDAIAILWLALYQQRLGDRGLRELGRYLLSLQSYVVRLLHEQGIAAGAARYSADVVVVRFCTERQRERLLRLGGVVTDHETLLLSINSGLAAFGLQSLLADEVLPGSRKGTYLEQEPIPRYRDFATLYPVPQSALHEVETTVQSWQVVGRCTIGFPLHMGTLAALGPVIGRFWEVVIPQAWVERTARELLITRMKSFGLESAESREGFEAAFTNGSTMGNRNGMLAALEQYPGAFVYFSAESHYSVVKALRDCDTLAMEPSSSGSARHLARPRYAQIPCDQNRSLSIKALVAQAVVDRQQCVEDDVEYRMILLANVGTTFVGATDDLAGIYTALDKEKISISYIHVDGALDFGFDTGNIRLGPSGSVAGDGMPFVQGVTVSHHKALGQMVSGEVIGFSPGSHLSALCPSRLNPRAVFETWLCDHVYTPGDKALLFKYCRENAAWLETSLRRIGVATKRNRDSIITVLERPPSWIIEEFGLRPEGDWVHLITMPNVSREVLNRFVDELAYVDKQFAVAFSCVLPLLNDVLGMKAKLKRVRCCSTLAEQVLRLIAPAEGTNSQHIESTLSIQASLRGALTVVAVDEEDEIQAVFLAGSNRDRSINIGPIFIRQEFLDNKKEVVGISRILVELLLRYLKAELKINSMSYMMHPLNSNQLEMMRFQYLSAGCPIANI